MKLIKLNLFFILFYKNKKLKLKFNFKNYNILI